MTLPAKAGSDYLNREIRNLLEVRSAKESERAARRKARYANALYHAITSGTPLYGADVIEIENAALSRLNAIL